MKILLVEDDRVGRMQLCHILRDLPQAELIETEDGLAAWQKLEAGLRPDVCIADLLMPRMDGVELVQRIRAHTQLRSLRVIICTMANDRRRMAEALALDVAGYLIKPITPARLLEEVRRVLRPATPTDLLAVQTESRSRMIINYYVQKMQEVCAATDRSLAQLRAALAAGDRAAADTLLGGLLENNRKNGLHRFLSVAVRLQERVYIESESELSRTLDAMAAESKRFFLAIQRLADPETGRDFQMDPPSTAALHQRFVAVFGF